ncbi:hypothetical protein PRK78_006565 [Emydomyces testavorans]|uniref:Uncharacterized protein n=1 Tax=Emydomyces testavorans TaxID=2070801 RepID=A0AAF0ILT7_9EURO|nr:hypothetical protein PRK78_006565 [Emydomyces testavorans]
MQAPAQLNDEADNWRKSLATWALDNQRAPMMDYTIDEKSNQKYMEKMISPFVMPLLKSMGLQGLRFTMWQFSTHIPIQPAPEMQKKKLYTIPITKVSENPQIFKDGKKYNLIPGTYIVTVGNCEITPEFDCLFVGDLREEDLTPMNSPTYVQKDQMADYKAHET